jgi:ADP-heptose:LPS heptosyltransferase
VNIAVIVEGGLVEVLQATPLLRTIAAGADAPCITLIGPPVATGLEGALPGVDAIVALRGLDGTKAAPFALAAAWREIRLRRFDTAVMCSGRRLTRLLLYLTGVPRRIGSGGGTNSTWLLSEYVRPRAGENNAAAWLRLAAAMDIEIELHQPCFCPGPEARIRAERELLGNGLEDGRLLVCLAPGYAWHEGPPEAEWDPERYAHLANQLHARHGAGVVLVGGREDRVQVDRLVMDLSAPHLDLTGQLSLREIAAILERSDLMVGGDSALLHLASAMGTTVVGLFGPTDGRRRGPYGADHRVVQAVDDRTPAARAREMIGVDRSALIGKIRVDDVLACIEGSLA